MGIGRNGLLCAMSALASGGLAISGPSACGGSELEPAGPLEEIGANGIDGPDGGDLPKPDGGDDDVLDEVASDLADVPAEVPDAGDGDVEVKGGPTGPVPGTTGAPCAVPDDCFSGYCVDGPDGTICTQTCTSTCPDGWACKGIFTGGADPDFICIPLFVGLCQPCAEHADCGSTASDDTDLCLDYGPAGHFCGADCGATGLCPEGFSCDEVALPGGLLAHQCRPADGAECTCNGQSILKNLSTACYHENASGTCHGTRFCGADGLTPCGAPVPQAELCNGADEDCDGLTDEDVVPAACEKTSDAGTCSGTTFCLGAVEFCDAPDPEIDQCDGKDNDCNGVVDDGYPDSDADGLADCLEVDDDADGLLDPYDDCPTVANPGQEDNDLDGQGDACDKDDDNDLVPDGDDCEPFDPKINGNQIDVCDGKDNDCDGTADQGFLDTDLDLLADCVDPDDDGDGTGDGLDNCPLTKNPDQANSDLSPDGGDACDPDDDDDLVPDDFDNCSAAKNFFQDDLDQDGQGDPCDGDLDGDGHANGDDNCPGAFNVGQKNTDGIADGGDACDPDDDQDFVPDGDDNCPLVYNPDQIDVDADGVGDACTFDKDGDGHLDKFDNCPDDANPGQEDVDLDGLGDACDPDLDGDLVPNVVDNCPKNTNPNQSDLDVDGQGDICDADADGDGDPNLTDCGPLNPAIFKGAPEHCNGIDDNCGGGVDEPGAADCIVFYYDADDDGFGPDSDSLCACKETGLYDTTEGGDCDDSDEGIAPGAVELCGDKVDNDCDDLVDEENGFPCVVFYRDFDDDGYGLSGDSKCLCKPAGDYTANEDEDCDDTATSVHPLATEICNAVDDDCDGETDEDSSAGCVNLYFDGDGDGVGLEGDFLCGCTPEGKYSAVKKGDCADDVPTIFPGAPEACNEIDDDCDGETDEEGTVGCITFYKDIDEDGYGTVFDQRCLCLPDVAGKYTTNLKGDCDDEDEAQSPGVPELCNEIDDDCDGKIDEQGAADCTTFFIDGDGDGYGEDGTAACLCGPDFLHLTASGGDCNDANATVSPVKPEMCDGLDNDCDGKADEGCDDDKDGFCDQALDYKGLPSICPHGPGDCNDLNGAVNPGVLEACDNKDNNCGKGIDEGCDDDGDGFCDAKHVYVLSDKCPNGGGDCDDQEKGAFPGGVEKCATTVDDDCSGTPNDEGALGCQLFHLDFDGDGSGSGPTECLCYPEGKFNAKDAKDCNDNNPAVHPTAKEDCGTPLDDNCNGLLSEDGAFGCKEFWFDGDGDFYGTGNPKCLCFSEGKYKAESGGDCQDADISIHPGQVEVCYNGKDDNCTGSENDEGAFACKDFHYDFDQDGFGTEETRCLCTAEGLFTAAKGSDCTDTDKAVNPAQVEVCGTPWDDNCDGSLNADSGVGCKTFFLDKDGDGVGTTSSQCLCVPTGLYAAPATGDCNDSDADIFPGAIEACDGKDNNCAGGLDEGCDSDGDGYCDASVPYKGPNVPACKGGAGDCNDLNPFIHPGATEKCNDIDENCVGGIDEGCDDDADQYCDGALAVVGFPSSCLKGPGDCKDLDPKIHPGAQELCGNDIDDDCSGITDDAGGVGSSNFFRDSDKDKWGQSFDSLVLCEPQAPYTAVQPGDCNDGNPTVHPGAYELCNAVDDDCNGVTDDGAADEECGTTIQGVLECFFGKCVIGTCNDGWADQDDVIANGCECKALSDGGAVCGGSAVAMNPATLLDLEKKTASAIGNIAPATDEDWFRVEGKDGADSNGCDNYHLKATLSGPKGIVFDVYRGGCQNAQQECASGTTYDFDVNKECPCVASEDLTDANTGVCTDQTAWYYIRVYMLPGAQKTCAPYTLTVTNGE